MAYDNTNSGTLGKNRKPKSDRSPQYTGKINLDGLDLWLSGWEKEDFMTDDVGISLALNRKDERECKATGSIKFNPNAIGNQPTYRGVILVDGIKYEIVAWPRKSNDGNKFLSIKATRFSNQANPNVARPPEVATPAPPEYNQPTMEFDDEIPF